MSDGTLYNKLKLLRNHGLVDRDTVDSFGYNSRLDTLQALVALQQLPDLQKMTEKRIGITRMYDEAFDDLKGFKPPKRRTGVRHCFHLYMARAERRNELQVYLAEQGIDTKIHYPKPLHLQKCFNGKYKPGDFPQCESDCAHVISLPVHPYLEQKEIDWVIACVRRFYESKVF